MFGRELLPVVEMNKIDVKNLSEEVYLKALAAIVIVYDREVISLVDMWLGDLFLSDARVNNTAKEIFTNHGTEASAITNAFLDVLAAINRSRN